MYNSCIKANVCSPQHHHALLLAWLVEVPDVEAWGYGGLLLPLSALMRRFLDILYQPRLPPTCTIALTVSVHASWKQINKFAVFAYIRKIMPFLLPGTSWEVSTTNLEKNLDSLPPATNFSIRVKAFNDVGFGPSNKPVFCVTEDDGACFSWSFHLLNVIPGVIMSMSLFPFECWGKAAYDILV